MSACSISLTPPPSSLDYTDYGSVPLDNADQALAVSWDGPITTRCPSLAHATRPSGRPRGPSLKEVTLQPARGQELEIMISTWDNGRTRQRKPSYGVQEAGDSPV